MILLLHSGTVDDDDDDDEDDEDEEDSAAANGSQYVMSDWNNSAVCGLMVLPEASEAAAARC
jgi:hypothetical protein